MKTVKQEGNYCYLFSRYEKIVAIVEPGEIVEIYTQDAYSGLINDESGISDEVESPGPNPQTGPIYVNGAQPGDTLAVHIHNIEPMRNFGISKISPLFGGLQSTQFTAMLNQPLEERVFKYTIDGDKIYHPRYPHLSFELEPFMGTMATAPKLEAVSTLTPFEHGGNMDVRDVKAGNIVYLPVAVAGAYFYTGDCHARQGDGELCGAAVEITAKAMLSFDIVKGMKTSWPRIESPTHYMAVGSVRPLEDAARIAWRELIVWMAEMGWDEMHAYQMLTQVGEMAVGNMVDTNYSMVAKIDKRYADYFK